MEPSSSTSSVITALKGRTQVHFQPTPADTGAMALSSSPSSSSFAMTSTWQQRLPSWSTSAAEEDEREGERAFRPPERTQSQKYDAWKDIFQRAEHYQDSSRKVQGKFHISEGSVPRLIRSGRAAGFTNVNVIAVLRNDMSTSESV